VAGQGVEVSFTVRQHGVTPVHLDEGVGIDITSTGGAVESFPAVPDGPTGHYVTEVVFPEPGTYTWRVRQGWFASQELGPIAVPGPAAAPDDGYRYPALVRLGLPAIAATLAAVAVADVVSARRRRPLPA
jgi:hypothetical protein